MNSFLLKIFKRIGLALCLLIAMLFLIDYLLKNEIDNFYVKLRSTTQNGLILGDSRALQGLNPEKFDFPVENFAFTISHSPYDGSYLGLIKKKISPISSTKKIHILSVTPWSVLTNLKDSMDLNPYFSHNLSLPLMSPNFEYMYKYLNMSFVNLLRLLSSKSEVSDLGWCKITMDSTELHREYPRRVREKIQNYSTKYPIENLNRQSPRILNLVEIIKYLSLSGEVVICRLPVSPEMLNLENQKFHYFNNLLAEIAESNSAKFIDLTDLNIQTTDGNHIYWKDVNQVSLELNRRIKNSSK